MSLEITRRKNLWARQPRSVFANLRLHRGGPCPSVLVPAVGGAARYTMSEYSMEQVEQVVQILYTDPSKVAQANEWLVGFTNSNAAWEVSVALLRSAQPNVRFFAANAPHMKVKSEGDELPRESLGGLLHTLLAAMQSPENAQANILTKLCLAVVALALHLSQESGKLQKMLLDSPAFLSLEPAPALEFFLLLPQEWERLSLTKRRQDQALAELALQLPRAVALIQAPFPPEPLQYPRTKRTLGPQSVALVSRPPRLQLNSTRRTPRTELYDIRAVPPRRSSGRGDSRQVPLSTGRVVQVRDGPRCPN